MDDIIIDIEVDMQPLIDIVIAVNALINTSLIPIADGFKESPVSKL